MSICAKCFEYTPKKASISSCVWPIRRKFNRELSGVIKVTKAQSLYSVQNQNDKGNQKQSLQFPSILQHHSATLVTDIKKQVNHMRRICKNTMHIFFSTKHRISILSFYLDCLATADALSSFVKLLHDHYRTLFPVWDFVQ